MPLTVSLPSILARLADGNRALPATGETVGEAVADVTRRFPSLATRLVDDEGQPYPFVTYYLNDEDIRFSGGFAAPIRDGDELTIVSAVAGG
jgi:molybdopterin converting factor small subunit